jgi:hypothetical protein
LNLGRTLPQGIARFNKCVYWKNEAATDALKKKKQIPQVNPQASRISG